MSLVKRRQFWLCFGLGLLIVQTLALFHWFGYDAPLFAFVLGFWGVILGLCVLLIAGGMAIASQLRWARRLVWAAGAIASFSVLQLACSIFFSDYLPNSPRNLQAKCEQLIPLLDIHHQETGSYPASLNRLENLPERVDFSDCSYRKESPDEYSFSVPGFWLNLHLYLSKTQTWTLVD